MTEEINKSDINKMNQIIFSYKLLIKKAKLWLKKRSIAKTKFATKKLLQMILQLIPQSLNSQLLKRLIKDQAVFLLYSLNLRN